MTHSSPRRPLGRPPIAPVALLLPALAASCGGSGEPPAPTPTPGTDGGPLSGPTFDELVGGGRSAEETELLERALGLPDLAFESNSEGLPLGGTWREHPCLGDLDGDGRADLIASNREENGLNVWRSVPGGPWVPAREGIPDDLMYGGSAVGDLDGDGDADFLFAAHKKGLRTFLGDGALVWSELEGAVDSPFLALDVALGDLNGDAHLDAITIAQFKRREGGLGVFLGTGDGRFEFLEEHVDLMGRSKMGVQVELEDMDGNGLDDLILTAEWGALLFTTHAGEDGALRFEDRSAGLPTPPSNMGNVLRALVPFDVEGDGTQELAFASFCDPGAPLEERHSLGVYRWNDGAATWERMSGEGLSDGLAYSDVLGADLDGDGKGDLVVIGPGLGASVYRGDGSGGFQGIGTLPGTDAGGRGALGDIDGDGRLDVSIICGATKARPDGGAVRTFLNRAEAWR